MYVDNTSNRISRTFLKINQLITKEEKCKGKFKKSIMLIAKSKHAKLRHSIKYSVYKIN